MGHITSHTHSHCHFKDKVVRREMRGCLLSLLLVWVAGAKLGATESWKGLDKEERQ